MPNIYNIRYKTEDYNIRLGFRQWQFSKARSRWQEISQHQYGVTFIINQLIIFHVQLASFSSNKARLSFKSIIVKAAFSCRQKLRNIRLRYIAT